MRADSRRMSALFRNGRRWNVFVVDGDRLEQADVQIGHTNDETAELSRAQSRAMKS